jgi:hypothetical protein
VHRLVAIAFIPNPENKPCINHKDGDKFDNAVQNLEWASYSENNQHAFDTHLKSAKGEANGQAKLTERKVIVIRASKESGSEIARRFGISPGHVDRIRNHHRWKHVA